MLYLFYGTDRKKAHEKAKTLIDSLRAKRPDAAYDQMTADNWNASVLEGHLGGQGLFSNKYIIFLDRISENEEALSQLPVFIPALKESSNIFIALEGDLKADLKKAFEKYAEKMVECELKAAGAQFKKKDFNIFSLGDAFGSRDAFRSWSIYRQAIENGLEPESIIGTLFWQIKSIKLAADSGNAGESGLNPFVYSKAKRYSSLFKREELDRYLSEIISLYHESHRGNEDLELGIERMLLGLRK